tara:strand:- start:173 stop:1801 length:1629 start_codon:yes stop_codon:yes gene_type:complete
MSSSSRVVAGHESHAGSVDAAARAVASSAPISVRQLLGVGGCVAICDLTIYRGEGFAGLALLFLLLPLLLWMSCQRPGAGKGRSGLAAMFFLLAVKMAWSGSSGLVAIGSMLIIPYVMVLSGLPATMLEAARLACRVPWRGWLGVVQCGRQFKFGLLLPRLTWLKVVLPLGAMVVFGGVFVQANPRILNSVSAAIIQACSTLLGWIQDYPVGSGLLEAGFCLVVGWIVLGLVRMEFSQPEGRAESGRTTTSIGGDDNVSSDAYAAARNTLVAVIALFAGYLVYEIGNLWFREFGDGFHYSGYAHRGAAWLTVALGLATLVLSLVFRGRILTHPRVHVLKRLAWTWSFLNVLLALSVFNRLFIYIDFNGLTRMRIVGLFGISTVVVGFAMVIWKIVRGHGFAWLIQRQLSSLAAASFLFAVLPVDVIWVRFNVERIRSGHLAPAVQLSVHPIGAGGVSQLSALLDCDDETIREGVKSLLVEHHDQLSEKSKVNQGLGWTTWQLAERMAYVSLENARPAWGRYADPKLRKLARQRFDEYTYQWY